MKANDRILLSERKSRLAARIASSFPEETTSAVLSGANVRFEVAARAQGLACGGIGLVHEFVRGIGLASAIDRNVHVLKRHFPYHESDHVLNLAYNVMAGGGPRALAYQRRLPRRDERRAHP